MPGSSELLKSRILQLASGSVSGECVIYVMSRDQRVHDNHALLSAQKHAIAKNLPLCVVFCLLEKVGVRSREHYEFMIKGLEKVEKSLTSYNIPFTVLIGDPYKKLTTFINEVTPEAIYFDFNPLRGPRGLQKKIAQDSSCSVFVVDTHNIVPAWVVSDKQEVGAYTLRPKLHRLLSAYLVEPESIFTHPHSWSKTMPSMNSQGDKIKELIEFIPPNGIEINFSPGEKNATTHLEEFIASKLQSYAVDRNDPSKDGQSDLSPYLHFGQISSLRVALRLREFSLLHGEDLHFLTSPKMPKPEQAKSTNQYRVDSLIEEMIVRKELADNYCYYNESYDSLVSAPAWAKKSLDIHREDTRQFLYSLEELESSKTHDTAWNAAQTQLTKTGKMHGYMRMYWAKKVLEWTTSPEQAIEFLIYLNDHYSIDGGDPNGYAGIMWSVGGVHDRPWQERAVFGVVRYMNYGGLKRKFDIEAYEKLYAK